MRFWVEGLKADVALLQETRVPPAGLAAARAQARDAGWTGVWEAAVPGELGGPASGGLAVLVRGGRRIARVPSVGRHPHRWLHTVVEAAEGRPLHVATVYGYDAGQPGAAALNAELVGDVLGAMAELGQAQWVVGGDWNEEADAIWELAAAGSRKLLLPRREGGPTVSTCDVGGRRIDFFVVAEALAGRAALEEVVEDPTLYPHKPVRLEVGGSAGPRHAGGLPQSGRTQADGAAAFRREGLGRLVGEMGGGSGGGGR
jgi:exonuclease III